MMIKDEKDMIVEEKSYKKKEKDGKS